ncbi:GH22432 [Drosophila grimshawi]|uniref:Cilia- and flagella-associated protein 206 n=1 Tax=Drosophila grimshawi TaxID=7222 RepID=B4K3C1_DROGR|nr:GH22432 [Drosophila grimshawi]
MSHPQHKFLDEITQRILAQLKERDIDEDVKFMKFVVHLMVRDMRRGLLQTDLNKPSACNIAAFIDDIVSGYLDKTDTTMANMRMSWIVKMGHGIQLSYVREQYEQQFQQQLKLLIADILQYPESCISDQLQFNCKETQLLYRVPLEQLHRINQFTVTFYMLQRCLTALKRSYEHTAYLVSVETGRYECVVAKINDTLSMRTSIQSELIFPHFVYLSKVWSNLNHYFNHIVELNKLREQLEQQVTKEMAHRAKDTITQIQDLAKRRKDWFECSFFERMDALKKYQTDGNFCSLAKADIKEFCGLTLAVTNGLLLPAKVQRKLCMNVDIKFGFQDETYARIGELWFERFITALRQAIFNSANLALLFKLDDALIEKELQPVPVEPPKTNDFNGQTEMVVTNDLSPSNWINVTWNAWDYHRETIHLAEIRKRQTHDAQTKVTYGQRNAQNQTYNTRQHL